MQRKFLLQVKSKSGGLPAVKKVNQKGTTSPPLSEIQEYARKNYDQLWDEYKRVLNPQHYPVDLAKDIWQDKMDLIEEMRNKANGEGEAK